MKVKRCNVKIELELTIFSIYNKTKLLKAIFYLKIDSQFLTSDPNTNDVDVFFCCLESCDSAVKHAELFNMEPNTAEQKLLTILIRDSLIC